MNSSELSTDPRAIRSRLAALEAAQSLLLELGVSAVTHLSVAQRSGVGRKTMYRHWPTSEELLHDTFAATNFPQAVLTGDLRLDLIAHLEALRQGLVHGPLAYVIHALNERAATDPMIARLRDRLTEEGCEPIRQMLRQARRAKKLPARLDVDDAAAQLEGPLFYRTLVRNERVTSKAVVRIVDSFLATVGLRSGV
jgi:AcrR family transcriptional regulator